MSYPIDMETDSYVQDENMLAMLEELRSQNGYADEPSSEVYDIGYDLPLATRMPAGFVACDYEFVSDLEGAALAMVQRIGKRGAPKRGAFFFTKHRR